MLIRLFFRLWLVGWCWLIETLRLIDWWPSRTHWQHDRLWDQCWPRVSWRRIDLKLNYDCWLIDGLIDWRVTIVAAALWKLIARSGWSGKQSAGPGEAGLAIWWGRRWAQWEGSLEEEEERRRGGEELYWVRPRALLDFIVDSFCCALVHVEITDQYCFNTDTVLSLKRLLYTEQTIKT